MSTDRPYASELIDRDRKKKRENRFEIAHCFAICLSIVMVVVTSRLNMPLPGFCLSVFSASFAIVGLVFGQVDKICRAIRGE